MPATLPFKAISPPHNPLKNPSLRSLITLCQQVLLDTSAAPLVEKEDWHKIIVLADRHRVMPLLAKASESLTLPDSARQRIQERALAIRLRNLQLTGEMLRIYQCCETQGISLLPFKGPTLAQWLYQDIGLRQYSDLDILFPLAHYQKLNSLLQDLGYKPLHIFSDQQFKNYLNQQKDFGFWQKQKRILIEMHYHLNYDPQEFADLYVKPQAYTQALNLNGHSLNTLDPETLTCYLAVHGSRHGWNQLQWLFDFHQALKKTNRQRLILLSHQFRADRSIAYGLHLCHLLLNDASINEKFLNRPVPQPLIQFSLATLHQPNKISFKTKIGRKRHAWYLGTSWREKRRVFHKSFTPAPCDWEMLRLPDALFFFYYVLRPFLWLWRLIQPVKKISHHLDLKNFNRSP